MKRILIATDGSAAANEAVELGIELAQDEDAEVIFVHVVPATDVVPAMGFPAVGAVPHSLNAEDREALDDAAAYAAERGIAARTKLLSGDTVDEIVGLRRLARRRSRRRRVAWTGCAGDDAARKRLARDPR